ncbi:MAG: alpha amylase C-terminal domain-containing protein [Deltaproteobacteria bacterium]|nr:alpha amylase C-terminal domain-containing protein [Deltaproteobacteria bacterium]
MTREEREIDEATATLLTIDPHLAPYRSELKRRITARVNREKILTLDTMSLPDFASGHEYFGLHLKNNEWILREWAPNATSICLIGDMTDWRESAAFRMERINDDGVWEIRLPSNRMNHGDHYRLRLHWTDGEGDRIPAYARRVVQDRSTLIFNAQVWTPPSPYRWKSSGHLRQSSPLYLYEAHVGMAQEEETIGTYREFTDRILPRIENAGYNAVQLMAIQEHPYYGSFGYQVSNYFAASSRFGTPEELKELVDTAHGMGLRVIMDLIHSHGASNEVEGLSRFDGTVYQYFHAPPRGIHPAWDSRCFDYGKHQVLHFLLSNCRFWLDEYHLDGFRFDGITSMLYLDHGLNRVFSSYEDYFGDGVDDDALVYLALANMLIHEVNPDAVTIAEDVSGMPGLAIPLSKGGTGFDYRFAMGIPDYWTKLVKEVPDEHWPTGHVWHELNNRRKNEKSISYCESHDQALVGDQTLIFRLIGSAMYDHMKTDDNHGDVDRGIALHKLIRLITLATAGDGYLNFMGNEFGHPEWIDFPRPGNNWSYRYARRQWHLADDPGLKYHFLGRFDHDMIELAKNHGLQGFQPLHLLHEKSDDKIIAFQRGDLLFVFNFHPTSSYNHYRFTAPPGEYAILLDSDAPRYGGHGRIDISKHHFTTPHHGENSISLYLPTRTALVLAPVPAI